MSAQPADSINPSPIPKVTAIKKAYLKEVACSFLQIGSPHRCLSAVELIRFWATPVVLGFILGMTVTFAAKKFSPVEIWVPVLEEPVVSAPVNTSSISITKEPETAVLTEKNNQATQPPLEQVAKELKPPAAITSESTLPANEVITYKIQSGDTLLKVWNKFGASVAGGLKAADALKAAGVPFTSLRPGDALQLKKSEIDEITFLSFELKGGKTVVLEGDPNTGYEVKITQPISEQLERKVSGTISHSFSLAAQAAAVPVSIVDDLADLFGSKIDFRKDIHRGDTFTIFYTETRTNTGKLLSVSDIQAASLEISGKLYAAVRHQAASGKVYYFDEQGKAFGDFFLRYPLQFSRISSVYSGARFHPVLNVYRPHRGVDFAATVGTPVRSIGDGVVEEAGNKGAAGNMIKISHGDRYSTAYKHLNTISKGLKKGSKISRGQIIGTVGATGLVSGPHLHFELYDNQHYVDPLNTKLDYEIPAREAIPAERLTVQLAALKEAHSTLALAKISN